MEKINRRQILKGISTLPLAAAAGALISCEKRQEQTSTNLKPKALGQFNVVVHGLFAMVFDNSLNVDGKSLPLVLMPPVVDMHAYGAGGWRHEQQLEKGACYQLSNVKSNTSWKLDPTKHQPLIQCTDKGSAKPCGGTKCASGTPPYCTICLPYPDALSPWRILPRPSTLTNFYNKDEQIVKDNQLNTYVQSLPLIHVLTYNTFSTPFLQKVDPTDSTKNKTIWTYQDLPFNLHLFADPAFDGLMVGHLKAATSAMNSLFNPALALDFSDYATLETAIKNPTDPPPNPYLDVCEQLTISEDRAGVCSDSTKGGAPRNCGNLLVQSS
jgi:hypothetical protein